MYRDVSSIRTTGCNVLNAQNQITNYLNNSRVQYTLIGNKYMEYSRSTSSYPYDTSSYTCYTIEQLSSLQSDFDYIIPIYQCFAIGFAFFLFYIVYKLFVHKFWRRLNK